MAKKELTERAANHSEDLPEAESFNADVERVLNFLEKEIAPAANGIALFAASGADKFFRTAAMFFVCTAFNFQRTPGGTLNAD